MLRRVTLEGGLVLNPAVRSFAAYFDTGGVRSCVRRVGRCGSFVGSPYNVSHLSTDMGQINVEEKQNHLTGSRVQPASVTKYL